VGGGKVVHYGVLVYGLHGGPAEEVSLARFAQGVERKGIDYSVTSGIY
jgi:hypothetical protein